MSKRFWILFFFFSFISILPQQVFADDSIDVKDLDNAVLFINQVRGGECCQVGSIDQLNDQIGAFKKYGLEATFTVRYDALIDFEYQKLLLSLNKQQFEIGGFLEITPRLAQDSGVEYLGNETNWSQAQFAYTLGYDFEDRKKIIDTYMNKFYDVFGYFPKTTTAWIMDTDSINYLRDEYGVQNHQITREQWGTDSYTLSGGPVHYPYFASRNWAFMPEVIDHKDNLEGNVNDNMLILRQTGADPLYNYGDSTNSYTTQPNDYMIDSKDISYFSKLVDQFFSYQVNSYNFVILGLENSMDEVVQSEFLRQIDVISKIDGTKIFTANKFHKEYADKVSESNITIVSGKDLVANKDIVKNDDKEAIWINAVNYRIRLLKQNDELKITDLRLYNQELEDPYNTLVAQRYGYWITPFIFDGSRFYSEAKTKKTSFRDFLSRLVLPELQDENLEQKPSQNDFVSIPDSMVFSIKSGSEISYERDGENITVHYINRLGNEENIKFNNDSFITSENAFNLLRNNSKFVKNIRKNEILVGDFFGLKINCDSSCDFGFIQPDKNGFLELREAMYVLFFPEIRFREIDKDKTVFYAHNKYAVVNKNPIRFVFIPRDNLGYSTQPKGEPEVFVNPEAKNTTLHEQEGTGTTFFDVDTSNIGKYKVTFIIDDYEKNEIVFVAPNCKEQKIYCLIHPVQAFWYLKSMFYTKLRGF